MRYLCSALIEHIIGRLCQTGMFVSDIPQQILIYYWADVC
jgi:hypothetical protein